MSSTQKILLIDSYDSFSLNLSTLIENVTGAEVVTIHSDSVDSGLLISRYLPLFDAVVIGPGPGSPDNPEDVGVLPSLFALEERDLIPIFGVCLGFQSLVLAFGGKIARLPEPKHGQVDFIRHSGDDLFKGIDKAIPVESVRYHSLHATPGEVSPIQSLGWTTDIISDKETGTSSNIDILMAGKHQTFPFWGVQYHPESICSLHGDAVFKNFWDMANAWRTENNRNSVFDPEVYQELKSLHSIKPNPLPRTVESVYHASLNYDSIDLNQYNPHLTVQICDELTNQNQHFTLLNSAAHPGRWSIIGLLEPGQTNCITYYTTHNPNLVYTHKYTGNKVTPTNGTELDESGIWGYLSKYMAPKIQAFKSIENTIGASFCGGLVGYISYEVSQEKNPASLLKPLSKNGEIPYPDVNLVDIERLLIVDSQDKKLYIVSLIDEKENGWFTKIKSIVNATIKKPADELIDSIPSSCMGYFKDSTVAKPNIEIPNKAHYIQRILEAQEELRAGNSYELCLTAQTTITLPVTPTYKLTPWDLYKVLYKKNPAPYSCLMDFQTGSTLVGSSPERFMSWNKEGICEFRPIKGTVKKSPTVTFESASAILNTPKERGENLMIVDLIRHDLNTLLKNVRLEKLMGVEEYETVYQLVSVIQGDLKVEEESHDVDQYGGFDVLVHSLPPGSMTGAPKIRSVEILHELEDLNPRGIYSGVSGYWSVFDEGDWSVVIRSAFKYDCEQTEGGDMWRIGAGGAITILSDPQDEWDEMSIKLSSALQAFE